jgi:hypothetical protein
MTAITAFNPYAFFDSSFQIDTQAMSQPRTLDGALGFDRPGDAPRGPSATQITKMVRALEAFMEREDA